MDELVSEKERAMKCLQELRNYIADDEALNVPVHDENFLIRFVRAKKYNSELAYHTVKKYIELRINNPQLFTMVFPCHEVIKPLLEMNNALLKRRDPMGRPIISISNPSWDLDKFNLDHIAAAVLVLLEQLLLTSVEAQINGFIFLLNLDQLSFRQVRQWTIRRIKYVLSMGQGSFPLRYNAVHIINQPKIFDIVMMAGKPFMTQKFKDRMIFHGTNFEKLHEAIPVDSLPEEYGGSLKSDEAYDKEFVNSLFSRNEYYKEIQSYGCGKQTDFN